MSIITRQIALWVRWKPAASGANANFDVHYKAARQIPMLIPVWWQRQQWLNNTLVLLRTQMSVRMLVWHQAAVDEATVCTAGVKRLVLLSPAMQEVAPLNQRVLIWCRPAPGLMNLPFAFPIGVQHLMIGRWDEFTFRTEKKQITNLSLCAFWGNLDKFYNWLECPYFLWDIWGDQTTPIKTWIELNQQGHSKENTSHQSQQGLQDFLTLAGDMKGLRYFDIRPVQFFLHGFAQSGSREDL